MHRPRYAWALIAAGLVPAAARGDGPSDAAKAGVPPAVAAVVAGLAGPVGMLLPAKDLIEWATTRQKPTTVAAFLGIARASARLEVMKIDGEVVVEGADSNVFGGNRIKLRVPCTFRYEVDLAALKAEDLRYDPARRVLTVRMPAVVLVDPVPDRDAQQPLERVNPALRSSKSMLKLRDRVLTEQLKPSAKAKGEEGVAAARSAGKTVLREYLQKVYSAVAADLVVIVE